MTETLEKALKERDRLTRNYRAAKRAQFERAYKAEPRLRDFARAIRSCGIDDALEMISLCKAAWLNCHSASPGAEGGSDPETRAVALEIVDRRIVQIREHAGLAPIDDPLPRSMQTTDALPWEADDVFQICKRILT